MIELKDFKKSLLNNNDEDLRKFMKHHDFTNQDMVHLYTIFECYTKKCEVFFANNESIQKEIDI